MNVWNLIAERKIREAMEEGAFDCLDGKGEPLDLTENPFEDPSLRMAHRLLTNNGFAPAWMEESKDIDAESHRLRGQARNQGSISPEEFRQRVEILNRRIVAFNLKAPLVSLHKRLFEIES